MTTGRAALALTAAVLVAGCAVTRMPEVAATREQTPTQHRLDVADCKAEVGYRLDYNGEDSPLANTLRRVFTLGAARRRRRRADHRAARDHRLDGQRRAHRGRGRGGIARPRDERPRELPLRARVDRLHGEPRLPDRCDAGGHPLR